MMEQDRRYTAESPAEKPRENGEKKKRSRRRWWIGAAAAALALALGLGIALRPGDGGTDKTLRPGGGASRAISVAQYPEMHKYPGEDESETTYSLWRNDKMKQEREPGFSQGLQPCMKALLRELLSGAGEEDRAASPVNVYMALAMLTELTDGESRQQILDVLGTEDLEDTRKQAGDVWNALYVNDTATTRILASSLWLDEDVTFNKTTLEHLAENYYASAYRGQMGTKDMDQAIQSWVNEQTGGLLKEQVEGIRTSEETLMDLVTTVFYQAKWDDAFNADSTKPAVFHGPGGDVERDFMYGTDVYGTYYWGEHFGAVSKPMKNDGGSMLLILPDEGYTPEDILQEDELLDFVLLQDKGERFPNRKSLVVHLAMPKFDISSRRDIGESLRAMGITDVFQSGAADFSPMLEGGAEVFLSKVDHGVRVAADEEGVTATAYTEMVMCGAAMPPEEEMDFVLDRPFLFVLTGPDSLPLFAGIVNKP